MGRQSDPLIELLMRRLPSYYSLRSGSAMMPRWNRKAA
jgi:hypothetical protein